MSFILLTFEVNSQVLLSRETYRGASLKGTSTDYSQGFFQGFEPVTFRLLAQQS